MAGIQTAADSPGRIALFNEIAAHLSNQASTNAEPANKKRKIDSGNVNGTSTGGANAAEEPVLLEVKEISVSVPQRKKFELCFTEGHIYARAPGTTAPIPAITYAWTDIEYIFYLPVPEKAQVQHNYVLFPRGSYLPSKTEQAPAEPLVFTVPATAPKQGTIGGKDAASAASVSDTYKDLFHWAIGSRLKLAGNDVKIVSADPSQFRSVIRQSHRPKETAVHVGGYRGSKDGFLFFLENGILWGFKKPLIFIPLNRIQAISYTNILQMTFNIVVEVLLGSDSVEEFEFGMLDQQDYGGIDDYIKTNRLQDRSMAEQRKAKLQLAENRPKKEDGEGENGDATMTDAAPNGTTELERAQAEAELLLQDDEDEDEEDYDPGSEGDSEGSGDSSDEDDDDDDDDDDDEDDDNDGEVEEEEVEEEEVEEEEVKEEPIKEEPPPVKKPARRPAAPKKEASPKKEAAPKKVAVKSEPAAMPVRRGWATISKNQAPSQSVDDEKFDVI
ncbi:hypothetical protein V2G26_006240 [Clonostachys chloroleuca]